jgi:hypothetical protein
MAGLREGDGRPEGKGGDNKADVVPEMQSFVLPAQRCMGNGADVAIQARRWRERESWCNDLLHRDESMIDCRYEPGREC